MMESFPIYANVNAFEVSIAHGTIACGLLALCIWILTLNTQNAGDFYTKPIEITMNFTGGFQSKESINKEQGGKIATFGKNNF